MQKAIYEALGKIAYPNKDAVWRQVVAMGKKNERRFSEYKFVPRGGLSSPHVAYMTDIDFIFNTKNHGEVSMEDFDALEQLVRELCVRNGLISAKVAWQDEDVFDGEISTLTEVRRHVEHGADLVVITGRYELRTGWQVPMDFTLQRGESKMSKEKRVARIKVNLEERNFAKVVSRIRSILSPENKAFFADGWNQVGGALRFLVKQLELVRLMPGREQALYMQHLRLSIETAPEAWCEVATAEMQAHALDLLVKSKDLMRGALGVEAQSIFAELDVAWDAMQQEMRTGGKDSGYPAPSKDGCTGKGRSGGRGGGSSSASGKSNGRGQGTSSRGSGGSGGRGRSGQSGKSNASCV